MKTATKYYLIEPTRYEQLSAQRKNSKQEPEIATATTADSKSVALVHPNVKRVNKIDQEMTGILNDDVQSDYDKMQQYASKLDSYLRNIRLALTKSTKDSIIGTASKKSKEDLQKIDSDHYMYKSFDQLISTVPKTYQGKAIELLKFMSQHNIHWDETGLVKVAGDPITGSNITQLVHDAVRYKRPTSQPDVYQAFKEALKVRGKNIQSYERLLPSSKDSSISLIPTRKRKAIGPVENTGQAWEELNL